MEIESIRPSIFIKEEHRFASNLEIFLWLFNASIFSIELHSEIVIFSRLLKFFNPSRFSKNLQSFKFIVVRLFLISFAISVSACPAMQSSA